MGHTDAALRLAELAVLEFYAHDHAASRRTIEIARDCADRTGNRIGVGPLAAIEIALDVVDLGFTQDRQQRFDETVAEFAFNPRLQLYGGPFAAEFGVIAVQAGEVEAARRHLDQALAATQASLLAHVASFGCRRLEALLLLAEGDAEAGRSLLQDVRAEAEAEGRVALVELIDGDLERQGRPSGEHLAPTETAPIVVRVLGPEFSVTVDDVPVAVRGYPAKLLALLVASRGSMTVDAAIEGLWPECDPDVGRNRLHGVLLRLRRGLGLPVDGPITCTEGIVRLEPTPQLEVDAWEFERRAADPETAAAALRAYGGDVLVQQFAYDDVVDAYRRAVRQVFLRAATAALTEVPGQLAGEDRADVARRLWETAPDDDTVCRLVAATLAATGQRAEAIDLVDRTASLLVDLGLDGQRFQREAVAELG
jgi:DNA-binding SARP family transcriptional activator